MPNPRKPKALKKLEGTDRPDRDYGGEPEFPEATSLDPPSSLISPAAEQLWSKLVGLLKPVGVISEGDLEPLLHLCNLHGQCTRLWESGMSPTAAQLTQLRMFFREFGLTPGSRSMTTQLGGKSDDPAAKYFTGRKAIEKFFDAPLSPGLND